MSYNHIYACFYSMYAMLQINEAWFTNTKKIHHFLSIENQFAAYLCFNGLLMLLVTNFGIHDAAITQEQY